MITEKRVQPNSYEGKNAVLRIQFENLNRDISSAITLLEKLNRECLEVQDVRDKALQDTELAKMEESIARARISELEASLHQAKQEGSIALMGLKEEAVEAKKALASLVSSRKAHERKSATVEASVARLERKRLSAEKKAKQAEERLKTATQKTKQALEAHKGYHAKEKDLLAIHQKNSQKFTETQRDLRKLEHYVRRLQRYYDKAGIKLNILPEFGIIKDRT